jgi:hypothetical protein
MCRSIGALQLRRLPPRGNRASALQFVRKLSSFMRPQPTRPAFQHAVDHVAEAARAALAGDPHRPATARSRPRSRGESRETLRLASRVGSWARNGAQVSLAVSGGLALL